VIEAPGSHAHPHTRRPLACLLSAGRNLAIALASFIAACSFLGWVLPFPEVLGISSKWEYFKAHRDEFDLVFIGSSRLYHQIIPAQFDQTVAAAGIPMRSFNFALDGVWPPESFYLLRKILSLRAPRLKWVVVELMDLRALNLENSNNDRTVYWHDSWHTFLALRDALAPRRRWSDKWPFVRQHVWSWLQRSVNYGRAIETIKARLKPSSNSAPSRWTATAGFGPGPEESLKGEPLARFTTALESVRRKRPTIPMRPVLQAELHDLISLVRHAGAEPIFILPPTVFALENLEDIRDHPATFRFGDPVEYPQLYDPALFYDDVHMNPAGARLFTDLLARKFIEQIGSSGKAAKAAPPAP
jgi:hypothetical protein